MTRLEEIEATMAATEKTELFCRVSPNTAATLELINHIPWLLERVRGLDGALRRLVHANEEWNGAVQKIIGKPPGWSDAYLDAARAELAKLEEE